jgi:ferrous iron transport protein B
MLNYGREIEEEIAKIESVARTNGSGNGKYDSRWLAMKRLENDRELRGKVVSPQLKDQIQKSISRIEFRHTVSDRIDSLLTNRILGIPVFLGLMYLVFHLTFTLGGPPMEWIEGLFAWTGRTIDGCWPAGSESLIKSFLVEGLIGGVGGVLVFLPNILLLFLAIAILEDSGYMARAAFITDQLMHKIGLHGKSFVPMLIWFGCSVPAIMASRGTWGKKIFFLTKIDISIKVRFIYLLGDLK